VKIRDHYRRSGEHPVHYIEFSKDAVDKILANSSSEKDEIIFVVKAPLVRDHFTYDEFVNYSWDQLEDILTRGGARAARARRAVEGQDKVLTANKLDFKHS